MSTNRMNQDPLQTLFSQPKGGEDPAEPAHVEAAGPQAAPPGATPAPGAPPRSAPDPREVARMIARAALAKAGTAAPRSPDAPQSAAPSRPSAPPAPPSTGPKPTPPKATPAKAAPAQGSPAQAGAGRGLSTLAPPRSERVLSAVEALEAARVAEAGRAEAGERRVEEARRVGAAAKAAALARPSPRPDAAPAISLPVGAPPASVNAENVAEHAFPVVTAALPGLTIRLAGARVARDRGTLTALWKAHRARFSSAGDLERAVLASVVVSALGRLAPGDLAAVHVQSDRGEYLVWVDLRQKQVLAALVDAPGLLAGL